jgi:hypothetical protein
MPSHPSPGTTTRDHADTPRHRASFFARGQRQGATAKARRQDKHCGEDDPPRAPPDLCGRDAMARNNSGCGAFGQGAAGVVRRTRLSWVRRLPGRVTRLLAQRLQLIDSKPLFHSGATTCTLGSFAESWVRSSDCWVRSSIPWVLVGSIVGSIVENRPKCTAIRYISNANGAYSGTLLPPMRRSALHNPRKCAAICAIPRTDVSPGGTCFAQL